MQKQNSILVLSIGIGLGTLFHVSVGSSSVSFHPLKKCAEIRGIIEENNIPAPSESPFYKRKKELLYEQITQEKDSLAKEKIQQNYFHLVEVDERLLRNRCEAIGDYFNFNKKVEILSTELEELANSTNLNHTQRKYLESGAGKTRIDFLKERIKEKEQKIKELNSFLNIQDDYFGKSLDPKNFDERIRRVEIHLKKMKEELEALKKNPHLNPGRLEYLKNYGINSKLKKFERLKKLKLQYHLERSTKFDLQHLEEEIMLEI